jgi:hypothetical protein
LQIAVDVKYPRDAAQLALIEDPGIDPKSVTKSLEAVAKSPLRFLDARRGRHPVQSLEIFAFESMKNPSMSYLEQPQLNLLSQLSDQHRLSPSGV